MRILLGWLLLAAVLPSWGGELPAYPFINVTGNAMKAVRPDLARVNFTVKARDASAEVAARTSAERAQEALDLLAGAGVAPADIDVHEIGKEVVFDRNPGTSKGTRAGSPHYEVSRSFSVVLRSVASWPDLGTKLLEMPDVEGLEAHFGRADRETLEAELVAAAAHDAQQRAERLAAGFGQRLGPVQAISQEPFEQVAYRLLRADVRYEYDGSASLRAGVSGPRQSSIAQVLVPATIPLGASVNALYRLESAPR